MKKIIVISFQLITISAIAQVQQVTADTTKLPTAPATAISTTLPTPDTNIHVHEPAPVQNTENKLYQYQRYNHGTSSGFRVQIDFGQDKSAVYKTQSDFTGKYSGVPTYVTYKQPYFRMSAGDFRTRLQAVCFLNKVRKDYPAAFVVADKIVPPPLN